MYIFYAEKKIYYRFPAKVPNKNTVWLFVPHGAYSFAICTPIVLWNQTKLVTNTISDLKEKIGL